MRASRCSVRCGASSGAASMQRTDPKGLSSPPLSFRPFGSGGQPACGALACRVRSHGGRLCGHPGTRQMTCQREQSRSP